MVYRYLGPILTECIIFYVYIAALLNLLIWYYPKDPITNSRSSTAKLHIILFTFVVFQIQINYFFACIKGPGFVPKNWRPNDKNHEQFLQYCKQCQAFKAPRSHHCRRLERCCLKMDHYCPWIGTTVGLYNQANFYRFLFFVPIGCLWACFIIFQVGWKMLNSNYHMLLREYGRQNFVIYTGRSLLLNFIAFGGALGTTLACSFLLYQQTRILLTNKTSIEKWICEKAADRQENEKDLNLPDTVQPQPFVYPYDLGKFKNITQVLGKSFFSSQPCCSGLTDWPVIDSAGQFDLTIEQLAQKAIKRALTRTGKIVKNFSGWWLPVVSFGPKTGCFKIPISDENRLKLDVAMETKVLVTRSYNNHWWYGQLENDTGLKRHQSRGWFPSKCVELEKIPEPKKDI